MKKQVWFWQLIVSPHMIYLAQQLATKGVEVHFVARQKISAHREKLGWIIQEVKGIHIHILDENQNFNDLLENANTDATHICQGLRGNGYIYDLIKKFKNNNKKFWVIMETLDPRGLKGIIRKFLYKGIFFKYRENILGILTIGYSMPAWLESIGLKKNIIYPFSYFLNRSSINTAFDATNKIRFIFVGNFTPGKQPNLIFEAMNRLSEADKKKCEILMLGSGVLENSLKEYVLTTNLDVTWGGVVNIQEVRKYISESDCLLLPSNHDGWGAVVSESLIEGTPVICSNSCGSAGITKTSKYGGTFDYNDLEEFTKLLKKSIDNGKVKASQRNELKKWANDLTVSFGADYLYSILFNDNIHLKPKWVD